MYDQLHRLLQEKLIIFEMGFKERKDSYIKFKSNTPYNFFIIDAIEGNIISLSSAIDLEVGLNIQIYGETILNYLTRVYGTNLDSAGVFYPCFYVCFKHYDENYRMDAYIVDLKINSSPIRYSFGDSVIQTNMTNDNISLRINIIDVLILAEEVKEEKIELVYKRHKKLILD